MNQYYKDYYWEMGLPHGLDPVEPQNISESFKIVMDPYRKYISIEKYLYGIFAEVIYDSKFLNFRHLKPTEQVAWQKEIFKEGPNEVISLIRNQDDRIVFKEVCSFEKEICRECRTYSPHGILLSVQKLLYKSFQDPFNGMLLYDKNEHLVMYKTYEVDEKTHQFTEMLSEQWNTRSHPAPAKTLTSVSK